MIYEVGEVQIGCEPRVEIMDPNIIVVRGAMVSVAESSRPLRMFTSRRYHLYDSRRTFQDVYLLSYEAGLPVELVHLGWNLEGDKETAHVEDLGRVGSLHVNFRVPDGQQMLVFYRGDPTPTARAIIKNHTSFLESFYDPSTSTKEAIKA